MDQFEQVINGVVSVIGNYASLAIEIYIIVLFFRMTKDVKLIKSQQDRVEQNIFLINQKLDQVEHNVNLVTQQQARIEQEIKQIRTDIHKEE